MSQDRPFDDILDLIETMPTLNEGKRNDLTRKMEEVCGHLSPLGRLCPDLGSSESFAAFDRCIRRYARRF